MLRAYIEFEAYEMSSYSLSGLGVVELRKRHMLLLQYGSVVPMGHKAETTHHHLAWDFALAYRYPVQQLL